MRTVALRWISTLRRVCRTNGWHKVNLFGWCSTRGKHWPNWTMTLIANSLQVLERNGGDDETRTRDLCRDSFAWIGFTTTYKTAGTAKVRGSRIRHRILWVGLWVENLTPRGLPCPYLPFSHQAETRSLRPEELPISSGPISTR